MTVVIRRLAHGAGLPLPAAHSPLAAGRDLAAAIEEPVTIGAGQRALVPTGFAVAIPAGFEGQVRPRSGLAAKNGVTVLNAPGTVDADYRGEIKVVLINLGGQPITITHGMRIAQLVIAPVVTVDIVEADELEATGRGEGGFGSTGHAG